MNAIRLFLGLLTLSAPALFAADDELPAPLRPLAALVEKCRNYDPAMTVGAPLFAAEFKPGDPVTWHAVKTEVEPPTVELGKQDDRTVLIIDATTPSLGFVAIGPPVKGDWCLEMVARSDSPLPSDLSLVTRTIVSNPAPDQAGAHFDAPAFQFGSFANTRNLLWTDTGPNNERELVELPHESLIQPQHWHTVRLKLSGRTLIGIVDGKELGRANLSNQFDSNRARQPMIYCFRSRILVSRFTIWRVDGSAGAKAKAWQQVFGELTPAQVDKQLAGLIAFLDHEDSHLRNGAQLLLTRAGAFVTPALRQVLETGTIEQRIRVREILGEE